MAQGVFWHQGETQCVLQSTSSECDHTALVLFSAWAGFGATFCLDSLMVGTSILQPSDSSGRVHLKLDVAEWVVPISAS